MTTRANERGDSPASAVDLESVSCLSVWMHVGLMLGFMSCLGVGCLVFRVSGGLLYLGADASVHGRLDLSPVLSVEHLALVVLVDRPRKRRRLLHPLQPNTHSAKASVKFLEDNDDEELQSNCRWLYSYKALCGRKFGAKGR